MFPVITRLLRIYPRCVAVPVKTCPPRRSWFACPSLLAMGKPAMALSSKIDTRADFLTLLCGKRPPSAWKKFAMETDVDEAIEIIDELGDSLVNQDSVGNILKYFAKAAAQSGNLAAVGETQRLLFVLGGKKAMKEHLEFKQYQAECLWFFQRDYTRAVYLIVQLLETYPKRRKDISNVVGYFMRDAVDSSMSSDDPKLAAAKEIVDEARRIFQGRYNIPMMNLWRPCFASHLFAHQVLAETLLAENPGALEVIHQRVPTILKTALKAGDVDLFHRTIEMELKYDMKNQLKATLGFLLYHYCLHEDVKNAQEVVSTILALDVKIPCEVMPFYFNLLSRKHLAIPQKILDMKYSERMKERAEPLEPQFKWW